MKKLKRAWKILKNTGSNFSEQNVMGHSAAIGFYTIFSLPSLLIIVIYIASMAFGEEAVRGELENQIGNVVGESSAKEIQKIIENAKVSEKETFATVIGIGALLFGATTVFMSIQNALDEIWQVKPKPQGIGILNYLLNRLLSFAMVVSFGFLLIVSLILDTLLVIFSNYIQALFSNMGLYLIQGINFMISLGILSLMFTLIFKVLPDVKIRWKEAWVGAFATTILFIIGKYLISFYMANSSLDSTYGAAGSIIIIFVWVYYSAVILLFGAVFTHVYTMEYNKKISLKSNTVRIEKKEVEHYHLE